MAFKTPDPIVNELGIVPNKYYTILARTRGMFGSAPSFLKSDGRELYFKDPKDRDAYLKYIQDNESPINNFNSYFPSEVDKDDSWFERKGNKDYVIKVNSLEDLNNDSIAKAILGGK